MKIGIPLPWLHLYALASLLVFLAHSWLVHQGFPLPWWVTGHLNDLLCIPLVGVLALHGAWLRGKDRAWLAGRCHMLAVVAIFSVYFEVYLPAVSPRYTGDPLDVLCYAIGALVFLGLQRLGSGPGHRRCRPRLR